MTSNPIPRLADLLTGGGDPRVPTEIVATVQTARDDGTVNLDVLGSTILAVPCNSGYRDRRSGDPVIVSVRGRQWRVVGRTGAPADLGLPKKATVGWGSQAPQGSGWHRGVATWVRETSDAFETYVQPGKPSTVSWGTGAPSGTGWHADSGGSVYVRETADEYQIYVDTSTPAPTPPPPTPPGGGTSPAPDPRDVYVTRGISYRNGEISNYVPAPAQGSWTSRGDYTGCWFYGSALHDALSAHTVKSAHVHLARSGDPHGYYRGVRLNMALFDTGTAPRNTPSLHSRVGGPSLDVGEATTWTMPQGWIDALRGSARGIAIYGSGPDDYVISTDDAHVHIVYDD